MKQIKIETLQNGYLVEITEQGFLPVRFSTSHLVGVVSIITAELGGHQSSISLVESTFLQRYPLRVPVDPTAESFGLGIEGSGEFPMNEPDHPHNHDDKDTE